MTTDDAIAILHHHVHCNSSVVLLVVWALLCVVIKVVWSVRSFCCIIVLELHIHMNSSKKLSWRPVAVSAYQFNNNKICKGCPSVSLWVCSCLQCFDAVGWAAESASGLQKIHCWGTGMVICLERAANDMRMVQLIPLPPHHLLLE